MARIGKRWDGAHTRRGVHGIPELTMGGVVKELAQCPDWEARGWCAHSQGSARHPWADHGVCVVIEPAQLHLTSMNEGVGPNWEAGDGVHTRRGVHGILEPTMGCV